MLDENIWVQLSEDEKFSELQSCLEKIAQIESHKHELSNTKQQGKLPSIKKELYEKLYKIIELENAT